jgi:hypothetical protein
MTEIYYRDCSKLHVRIKELKCTVQIFYFRKTVPEGLLHYDIAVSVISFSK